MTSRAVVLGGGGVAGIGWEVGLVAGLVEAGVDLAGADLIVGTSAGSVVGAQIAAGRDPEEMYGAQLAAPPSEIPARLSRTMMLRWGWTLLSTRDVQAVGAKIGAMALAARTVSEPQRRAVIEKRLAVSDWPARRLLVTAVDAQSGEFVVFDRDSGVALVDAVAASCAVPGVWPAITIAGRRYIDGGVRSAANVDLADGYDRVVVIAPLYRGGGPVPSVAKQVAGLSGRAVVVTPDAMAKRAFGRNVLDPSRRAPAARAGRAQAAAEAPRVAELWQAD